MGAWGPSYFEDDAALDFMADVEEAADPEEKLREAFDLALESEYLETDEGNAVIVAAIYVDRQVNGTRYSPEDRDEPWEVDTFPDRHPGLDLAGLKPKAIEALKKVLADNSELNELWAENEEDHPAWRRGVENLLQRLDK